jgi:hypothetical protein
MNRIDEDVRDVIANAMTEAGIDARNLDVEVNGDCAVVAGTVPNEDERVRLLALLETVAPGVGGVAAGRRAAGATRNRRRSPLARHRHVGRFPPREPPPARRRVSSRP